MKLPIDILSLKTQLHLIVGVSGGPDSVALLHALKHMGFENIIVAHLDHQIREESHEDAELVQKLAEDLGCVFELKILDISQLSRDEKENLEALGRRERYAFFDELKKKYNAQAVVTAHHADDQVETVLMNMIRGCGLEGLQGMKCFHETIWRPLLHLSKTDLLAYCSYHQLSYIDEPSNADTSYRRNFLRHEVVPKLKELNPSLLSTFENNMKLWTEAFELFEQQSRQFLSEHMKEPYIVDLQAFLTLEPSLQPYVLRQLFEMVHGHKQNLVQEHLEQVLKVLRTNVSGKQKEFGSAKMIRRDRETFTVIDA